jgi:DNA mismatch repair protein MutS
MAMRVDPLTLLDLSILEPGEEATSLFVLLDRTRTECGRVVLRKQMRELSGPVLERQAAVRHLAPRVLTLQRLLDDCRLDQVEKYLSLNWQALTRRSKLGVWIERWTLRLKYPDALRDVRRGVETLERLLQDASRVAEVVGESPRILSGLVHETAEILDADEMRQLARLTRARSLPDVLQADRLARGQLRDAIRRLVAIMAELDALQSLAAATVQNGWTFPELVDAPCELELRSLRHPRLPAATPSNVRVAKEQRVMAITGPNMAGKSTLLKAIGNAIYLAHLGCGVPAARARIPLFDAMLASLVVRDSISSGRSFYLSEVRRIRDLTVALAERSRVFAILDEPFKGTNIPDASDATSLLVRGLCAQDQSLVILTTHLSSVVAASETDTRLAPTFLGADVSGDIPLFDYQLRPGISTQRLGMVLLEREGVAPALVAAIERRSHAHRPT